MRLNRKTGNRQKRASWTKHYVTGHETEGRQGRANSSRQNRRRNGRGVNAGRRRTAQRTRRKRWTSSAHRNWKRDGTDGAEMLGDGLTTRQENGRLKRNRWAISAQLSGKTGRNRRETIRHGVGWSVSTVLADHSNKLYQTNQPQLQVKLKSYPRKEEEGCYCKTN